MRTEVVKVQYILLVESLISVSPPSKIQKEATLIPTIMKSAYYICYGYVYTANANVLKIKLYAYYIALYLLTVTKAINKYNTEQKLFIHRNGTMVFYF